jgi:hypothetical protein
MPNLSDLKETVFGPSWIGRENQCGTVWIVHIGIAV